VVRALAALAQRLFAIECAVRTSDKQAAAVVLRDSALAVTRRTLSRAWCRWRLQCGTAAAAAAAFGMRGGKAAAAAAAFGARGGQGDAGSARRSAQQLAASQLQVEQLRENAEVTSALLQRTLLMASAAQQAAQEGRRANEAAAVPALLRQLIALQEHDNSA
jgi:hypothetical protein